MDIGIIVFAYNRSHHLKNVLDGLRENKGISKLYIFQDGLKCEEHRNEWEKTQLVIDETDWCEVVYTQALYNKGLANSIVDGINIVFEENDAVIVLEDDCVPAANFVSFMQQCLEKYQSDKRVYSVSGYRYPIDLPEDEYDVYCCGRVSSWGWGTWSDRWEKYVQDYEIVRRINNDKEKSLNLALWGRDLENMLVGRLRGLNDSWAVFWALSIIEVGGFCIAPYKSLIRNIGLDGSGVHCGVSDKFEVQLDESDKTTFRLPENVIMKYDTKVAFADLYGSYTACGNKQAYERDPIVVYGAGNCFRHYEKIICEKYDIVAFIDRGKKGWFAGKKVIRCEDINIYNYTKAKILIMLYSYDECIKVRDTLTESGHIPIDRIVMFQDLLVEDT